jgi:hypothetical protein
MRNYFYKIVTSIWNHVDINDHGVVGLAAPFGSVAHQTLRIFQAFFFLDNIFGLNAII